MSAAPPRIRAGFWIRWSARDLLGRWIQVLAVAVIIAIGSGVYAGLSSNTTWRRQSYDLSYEALASHDLIASTPEGSFAPRGSLIRALDSMPNRNWVEVAEEKVVVDTQVEVTGRQTDVLLVPGRMVGYETATGGGPRVDMVHLTAGRMPEPEPSTLDGPQGAAPEVLLDHHFAAFHDLPPEGSLLTSGGGVTYTGTAYTPEYFTIASDQVSFLAEAGFAVLFAPTTTVQALAGTGDQVNQLAVILAEGVDAEAAQAEIQAALDLAAAGGGVGADVEWIEEERLYRRLYDDIESDQKLFNIFASLILAGAAFAAFNLVNRIVEAQRREIGIGMALGVPPRWIALRPLLVGVEIAVTGTLVGIGFGLWVGSLVSELNQQFVPLPVWVDDFQAAVFARGAGLALVLVVIATAVPVARAVRVDPVDTLSSRPGGPGTRQWSGRTRPGSRAIGKASVSLPWPGGSVARMPLRNVARSLRRTVLTTMGIGAAIAVMVGVNGLIDSFRATIERNETELLGSSPDRATVTLDFFHPVGDPVIAAVRGSEAVADSEPLLVGGGTLTGADGTEVEVLVSVQDFDNDIWSPTRSGTASGAPDGLAQEETREGFSIVLSSKAARDLGVEPGETVSLNHPRRDGLGYEFVDTEVTVDSIHGSPYRFLAYMDDSDADLFGMEGIVNALTVVPTGEVSLGELKRALFGQEGVAAVEGVNEVAESVSTALEELLGLLNVISAFVLLMALLIAFNATSISSDERKREHATMLAFGLPTRTVMSVLVTESLILGVIGTLAGMIAGRLLLGWLVAGLMPDTVPDIDIIADVSPSTYIQAALAGVVAVAVAPLLTYRKLHRMDVPATLRVVE